jgi:hypothetical protein
MNFINLLIVFFMTFCSSFVEGGWRKKIKREVKRVKDQVKNNPVKFAGDALKFAKAPEATTVEVLKRILKKK